MSQFKKYQSFALILGTGKVIAKAGSKDLVKGDPIGKVKSLLPEHAAALNEQAGNTKVYYELVKEVKETKEPKVKEVKETKEPKVKEVKETKE